jgi:hypothetical protein
MTSRKDETVAISDHWHHEEAFFFAIASFICHHEEAFRPTRDLLFVEFAQASHSCTEYIEHEPARKGGIV